MSDRTWNQIDARLYEEDWSQGAIITASCLIARCPNQYGVFDTPLGFLKLFFRGLYTASEIEGFMIEWEGSGFVKFYRNRKVVWIRKKWCRNKYSKVPNNRLGAMKFVIENFPDVVDDFKELYPLSGDSVPTKSVVHPTSDSESESESDNKKIMSPKTSDDKTRSAQRIITDAYQDCYIKAFEKKPTWDSIEGKRIKQLLKRFDDDAERVAVAIRRGFDSDDMFIRKTLGSFLTLTAMAIITQLDAGKAKSQKKRGPKSQWSDDKNS